MRVTFLGTGTSRGVPVIGCNCRVCRSPDPRNKRLRSSVLLESEVRVIIDTSVDFRAQMLRQEVTHLDAVVYTHHHMDHILGLDDLFPFNARSGRPIPAYGSLETLEELRNTFRHLFAGDRYPGIAEVELRVIQGPFQIGDLSFEPVEVFHGRLPVLGFRIGNFAYVTDVSEIPPASWTKLTGLDVLVLDGLRYRPHATHLSLDQAAEIALSLQANRTFLIHMSHEIDHAEANARLPDAVRLSYDGLVLEVR